MWFGTRDLIILMSKTKKNISSLPSFELKWHIETCHGFSLGLGHLVSSPLPPRVPGLCRRRRRRRPGCRVCAHKYKHWACWTLTTIFVSSFPHSDLGLIFLDLFFPEASCLVSWVKTLLGIDRAQLHPGPRPPPPWAPGLCAGVLRGWAPDLERAYLEKGHWTWEGPPPSCLSPSCRSPIFWHPGAGLLPATGHSLPGPGPHRPQDHPGLGASVRGGGGP